MATYPNGEIPAEALTRTSTGHLLRADAAAAFESLADAFAREFGKPLKVTDAYRPKWGTNGQVEIFEDRYPYLTKQGVNDQRGPWKGKRWWRRKNTAAAAVPGTSNHGWGLALDLGSNVNNLGTREQLWLVANGPRFGWVWPTWARKIPTLEPWHYEFIGTVNHPIGTGGGALAAPTIPTSPAALKSLPINIQEDEMFRIQVTESPDPKSGEIGRVYLVRFGPKGEALFVHIAPTENAIHEKTKVPLYKVSHFEKDTIRAAVITRAANWKVS